MEVDDGPLSPERSGFINISSLPSPPMNISSISDFASFPLPVEPANLHSDDDNHNSNNNSNNNNNHVALHDMTSVIPHMAPASQQIETDDLSSITTKPSRSFNQLMSNKTMRDLQGMNDVISKLEKIEIRLQMNEDLHRLKQKQEANHQSAEEARFARISQRISQSDGSVQTLQETLMSLERSFAARCRSEDTKVVNMHQSLLSTTALLDKELRARVDETQIRLEETTTQVDQKIENIIEKLISKSNELQSETEVHLKRLQSQDAQVITELEGLAKRVKTQSLFRLQLQQKLQDLSNGVSQTTEENNQELEAIKNETRLILQRQQDGLRLFQRNEDTHSRKEEELHNEISEVSKTLSETIRSRFNESRELAQSMKERAEELQASTRLEAHQLKEDVTNDVENFKTEIRHDVESMTVTLRQEIERAMQEVRAETNESIEEIRQEFCSSMDTFHRQWEEGHLEHKHSIAAIQLQLRDDGGIGKEVKQVKEHVQQLEHRWMDTSMQQRRELDLEMNRMSNDQDQLMATIQVHEHTRDTRHKTHATQGRTRQQS